MGPDPLLPTATAWRVGDESRQARCSSADLFTGTIQ
jgi:hypothetical protein